ncbi:MAG: cytochrome c-type biogenesis protein CcmH [Candidatus Palauibacterales bacterium]|nr:cytochrome c-type biogenesis protein CcmH [Candidatus Palauibacterales bacterium]
MSGVTARAPGVVPAAAAAALLLLALPATSPAQQQAGGGLPPDTTAVPGENSPRVDTLTVQVASELRCPVCRSQSVLESSSDLAERMQAVIRDRLARGESPAEVRAYFVDKYGEWILLRPEPEGINLLVYVLPALALVGGGWAVVRQLRRWSTDGVTDGAGEEGGASDADGIASDLDELSEEDREWLEGEMERRR